MRTQARFSQYQSAWEACRDGGFSLSRLVCLPPEGLALAGAEPPGSVRFYFDPALAELVAQALDDLARTLADTAPAREVAANDPARGPALELSLLDGRLDPRRIAAWMSRHGLKLLKALAEALARPFALVGHAQGGEEVALLCLFALMRLLQDSSVAAAGALPAAVALLFERAVALAVDQPSVGPQAFRSVALRAGLVGSHLAFQKSIEAILASPINTYRTSRAAMTAARDLVKSEADLRSADETLNRIAAAMLASPEAMGTAWVESAAELLRDALAEAYLSAALPDPLALQLSRACSEPQFLCELVADHEQREALQAALAHWSPEAFKPTLDLLHAVGLLRSLRHEGEAPPPLPQGGGLPQLAADEARGAYLIAADSVVRKLLRPLEGSLQPASDRQAEREWKRGRRYRLGLGSEATTCAPAEAMQAHLFIDLQGFARRVLKIRSRAIVDLWRTDVLEATLACAARLRESAGGDDEALSVSAALAGALCFRGEIAAAVALAVEASSHLAQVRPRFDETAAAALSDPRAVAFREGAAALARLEEQRRALDTGPVAGRERDRDAARQRLKQAMRDEGELRELQRSRREALFGGELEFGVFVSHGGPASLLSVGNPAMGKWSLAVSERIDQAAQGTARRRRLRELRAQWIARGRGLPLAFAVTAGGAASAEIYNEGCAVSGEALTAFRAAAGKRYLFLDRTLPAPELDLAFSSQLSFPPDEPVHLVLACDASRALVYCFRHAGSVRFEGSEAPTEVWESCDPGGLFARLVARRQLPGWLAG
ncbi:MAG TPA: hypothetical protein VLW85_05000 [Myxococcales bacterium]|nr:hypothetical protein [Myxococcales bacterium]